jgi:microcystin-dependent protein
MADTFEDYPAQANQLDPSNAAYGFVFNFPYLEDTHVTVEVDGTLLSASNYTIQTSPDTRVLISSGVTVGQKVRVRRNSNADSDNPYVDFVNGSVLNETDQDNAYRHNLYLNEELAALNQQSLQKEVGGTNWDAQNLSIVNLPTPTLSSEATSKTYVDTQVATAVNGSPQTPVKYAFTGDGSNAAFTFSPGVALDADEMYEVAIDGVLQEPTTAYTINANANTITFTSVPPNASKIVVINRGYLTPVVSGGIADGSITSAQISTTDTNFNIQADGNVGIGTNNPSVKLAVNGSIETIKDRQTGTPEGGQLILRSQDPNGYRWNIDNFSFANGTGGSLFRLFKSDEADSENGVTCLTIDPVTGDVNITGDYKVNGASLIPTGTVSAYAGSTAPTGYVLCDGSQYNQVGTYAALFAVLSTTYNTGGETANHFRVPDLKGRAIAGMGGSLLSGTDAVADTGGAKEHTLTAAESGLPDHTHDIPVEVTTSDSGSSIQRRNSSTYDPNTPTTTGADASSAHNNVQPTMILNYIIKI